MKPTQPGYFDREECRPFYHRGGDNGILLVHGFTGSAAHMRPLADELARRGRTVRTINLPGHAQTEEDHGPRGLAELASGRQAGVPGDDGRAARIHRMQAFRWAACWRCGRPSR